MSFEGLTNFFNSAILDVLSDGVESFIGICFYVFLFLLTITNRKRVYYAIQHIYFYASKFPDLSSSNCAVIFFLHTLCIFTQKKMSNAKMGRTRYSLMPMFITMAS